MTTSPKEKAKELVEKYRTYADRGLEDTDFIEKQSAKACAIIDCQNTIDELEEVKQSVDDNIVYLINQRVNHYESIITAIESM